MRRLFSAAVVVVLALFPSVCLTQPPDKTEDRKILGLGKPFDAPGFQLTLVSAEIDANPFSPSEWGSRIDWWDSGGGSEVREWKKKMFLIFTFRVKNTDNRKLVRFDRISLSRGVELDDDVNNSIRPCSIYRNYDGEFLVGGLKEELVELLPGTDTKQIQVFAVPPPKTKYVILTMDLGTLGEAEKKQFKVPTSEIKHFDDEATVVDCLPTVWRNWTVEGHQLSAEPVTISALYVLVAAHEWSRGCESHSQ